MKAALRHVTLLAICMSMASLVFVAGTFIFNWFSHPPETQIVNNSTISVNYGGVGIERNIAGLLFLIASVTIWLPKPFWRRLTLVSLGLVLVEYILWSITTFQIWRMTGYLDNLYLRGARPWDLLLLLITVIAVIFLMQIGWRKNTLNIP